MAVCRRTWSFLTLCAMCTCALGMAARSAAPCRQPAALSALARRQPAVVHMRDGSSGPGAKRKTSAASSKKFQQLEEQAMREPADRTAGKIVAGGLLVGLGGAIAFAAANGYLNGPSLR